ncbi:hypothetical protein LR48_Vigan08g118300 [Vigna angularis]|uniref:Ubiquitin-like domain-containing protein n=1 Tax=Phaseolus angularis TaxID=3914 RepID=A0A0L9V5N6_PHAAN|nr:uncharacterized protein HKW66_Vig0144520 [Vigna angularis]KOM50356.1 hypothetical protein LR48_Vigan08g118300 [Vigna angularis]
MKVVMENLTGTLCYIEVKNDATVEDLKKEIERQQKVAGDRLILVLHGDNESLIIGKEEENMSLFDCGIQDGSHIYLFFNPLNHDSIHNLWFSNPFFYY